MEQPWAVEHLQVIRTLMERSALYRRALAPVMMTAGGMGIAAAATAMVLRFNSAGAFASYWIAVSGITLIVSFLLVRRQALKDGEPIWSLPARRVAQALVPGFASGVILSAALVFSKPGSGAWLLPPLWMLCYGTALHAAGFFMPRGIRLLGWLFIAAGAAAFATLAILPDFRSFQAASLFMGVAFGIGQIAYGAYLSFSERPAS